MEVLKELHSAIAIACEASFDKAYKDLESIRAARETEAREAENNALNASETRQAAERKIEDLQREIAALREELHHYHHDEQELELPEELAKLEHDFAPKQIWDAHTRRPDQLQRILEHKYTTLYTNLQTFGESWNSLKAKVLQHKKKLRHWEKQLERDEFTLLLHGAAVTFRRVHNLSSKDVDNAALSPAPTLGSQTCVKAETTHASRDAADNAEPVRDRSGGATQNREDKHEKLFSNQQDSSKDQLDCPRRGLVSSESSSDALPLLPDLHTRKRKRTVVHSESQATRSDAEQSIPVKNEPMSSSPAELSAQSLGQQLPSTQDLDEVGDTVQTPTKHRARREVHYEEPSALRESNGSRRQQLQSGDSSQQNSILQPVDGNARIGRPPGPLSGIKRPKKTDQRAFTLMAEDGDFGERGTSCHRRRSRDISTDQKTSSKSMADGRATQDRLQGLLNGSLPTKSPLASTKSITGAKTTHSPTGNTAKQNRQNSDDHSSQPLAQPHRSVTESGSQICPEVHPEDEPFRSLPLHRLNLDHFKINPARNKGLDYAYGTVVRKKDERKCISGCTRPGCCGDRFRAMARLGGLPQKSSSTEQEQEDRRILEEYVGDDRSLLDELNAQERENLLVEARARILANQYGRHRHSHQRARTPPGFWRTEMPDTQELRSDREAAQRLELEKVEERYREAMRPGGLWTWADE